MDAHAGDSDPADTGPAPTGSLVARLDAAEQALAGLAARLDRAEAARARDADELAILRLVASYSPRVDAGDADGVAELWAPDGVYDVDTGRLEGREQIAAMVRGEGHRGLIAHGCGHVPGLPVVHLDGDTAVVTGHSQLVVRSSRTAGFTVLRLTANRWELVRSGDPGAPDRGWRVAVRTARLIDDDGDGRALLGRSRTR